MKIIELSWDKFKNPSGVSPYEFAFQGKVYTLKPGESIKIPIKRKKGER